MTQIEHISADAPSLPAALSHTVLKAASGWNGNVGPNLDSAQPTYQSGGRAHDQRQGRDALVQGHVLDGQDRLHRLVRRDRVSGWHRRLEARRLAQEPDGRLCGHHLGGTREPPGAEVSGILRTCGSSSGSPERPGAPYAARVLDGLRDAGAEIGVCAVGIGRRGDRLRGVPRPLARPGRGRSGGWSTSTAAARTRRCTASATGLALRLGSARWDGCVICPCSMATAGTIATSG